MLIKGKKKIFYYVLILFFSIILTYFIYNIFVRYNLHITLPNIFLSNEDIKTHKEDFVENINSLINTKKNKDPKISLNNIKIDNLETQIGNLLSLYELENKKYHQQNEQILNLVKDLQDQIKQLEQNQRSLSIKLNSDNYHFLLMELLKIKQQVSLGKNYKDKISLLIQLSGNDQYLISQINNLKEIKTLSSKSDLINELYSFQEIFLQQSKAGDSKPSSKLLDFIAQYVTIRKVKNFSIDNPELIFAKLREAIRYDDYQYAYEKISQFKDNESAQKIFNMISNYYFFDKYIYQIQNYILSNNNN